MKNTDLKNIIQHLRFPFSILLLPVFLFALYPLPDIPAENTIYLFLILHLLVYPSSNGYNSLMDDDKGSIGGLKHPPKVPAGMLWVTWLMDITALGLSWVLFSGEVSLLLMGYILASRAYSYRKIRLKKYPWPGFLTVTLFQGPVIYILTIIALAENYSEFIHPIGVVISYLVIAAGYPLSQVYQHAQDKEDGVTTVSMVLGVKGTFIFSGVMFAMLGALFGIYFIGIQKDIFSGIVGLVLLIPSGAFFVSWMLKCFRETSHADYDHTMKMNKLGAISINVTFLMIILKNIIFG